MGNFRLPRALEILLGAVVLLELITPFFADSYGVDGGYHLTWIREFISLVDRGVAVPRWIPEAYSGFGAPTFYFYPPLAYYVAYCFHALSGIADAKMLFQLTALFATVVSFFTARALLGLLGASNYQRNLGALIYAFAPYRIAEVYSRSNLSMNVGYIFVPLIWYGIILIIQSKDRTQPRGIIILAVSLALLILTNIPFFLLTTLCAGIAAVLFWKQITLRHLRDAVIASFIAVALTAFHFSSALSFRKWSNVDDLFVQHPDFILTYLRHGSGYPAAYHILLIAIPFVLVAVVYYRSRKSAGEPSQSELVLCRMGIALAALLTFLNIPRYSVPFWEHLPPLPLIQDCWRFYSMALLLTAIFIGIAESGAMRRAATSIVWVWVLGAFIPILLVLFNVHLYHHYDRPSDVATEYLPLHTVSKKAIVPVMRRHAADPPVIANLVDGEFIRDSALTATSEMISVNLTSARQAAFHRFDWPAWHLYAGGTSIPSAPDSIGRATAVLPSGQYKAQWRLERTSVETVGGWISVISWGALIFASGISRIRKRVRTDKPINQVA